MGKEVADGQLKVETVSKIDTRLLQEKKVSVDASSWFSRYSSLLVDFQKLERELLAYRKFFANWDIPVNKDDKRVSRNLFEEIEKITEKLREVVIKLDEIRLDILLNEDLNKDDKDELSQKILQLKNGLQKIYFIPLKKNAEKGEIVDINIDLKAVIFELGIENNVFEGSRWVVRDENRKIIVELQVLLVKRNLAFAQIVKGNIKSITKSFLVERKIKE